MTKQEFLDSYTNWSDVIYFCSENGYTHHVDDIHTEYDYNEIILDDIDSKLREGDSWESIKDYLEDLPYGCDYYYRDDYSGWCEADDYRFDEILNNLVEELDEDGFFDEEEEVNEPPKDIEVMPDNDNVEDDFEEDNNLINEWLGGFQAV